MKLKVVSDGTTQNTKIFTENGDVVEHVRFISINFASDETENTVVLELFGVPVDVICEGDVGVEQEVTDRDIQNISDHWAKKEIENMIEKLNARRTCS